jgi:RNA recognition motif-containing protein
MGKDKKEKSKSPKKSSEQSKSPKKSSEQSKSPKPSKTLNINKDEYDDSNASMSVENKSPRKQQTEVIQVEEFNGVAEEKLAHAEATIKRVRGNVKKRKYQEKPVPDVEVIEGPVEGTRLFIGNVSPVATKEDVTIFFAPIGKVVDYQVIVHTTKDLSSRPNAFSFVTLESPEAATQAIAELDGKAMANYPAHNVQVKHATPKTNKNKKNKTSNEELPKKFEKKVEKKVEKVEKKLEKAEKKIEKADKKS